MKLSDWVAIRGIELYQSTQIEGTDRRNQLSFDVLAVLVNGYELRLLGKFPGNSSTVYVRTGAPGNYAIHSICDNGGEFNVEPVNHGERMRSIPYVDRLGVVDAGTVAYRIAMVIKGEDIDWDARWPDLVEDFARGEAVSS
jgi:hypothetical protein